MDVLAELLSRQDIAYQQFHSKLCPGVENIIGVRMPQLRILAKTIARGSWEEILASMGEQYYEERMLRGLVITQVAISSQRRMELLRAYLPLIDNWAICDAVAANCKEAKKQPQAYWEFLQPYFSAEGEYQVRFAVVMLLDHFLVDEYIDQVLDILSNITREEYYIVMAVAWALSIAYIRYPQQVEALWRTEALSPEVTNKSIQKCRESLRIDKQSKEKIKQYKR